MNFCTGLIFANKEAVKRALTIYATKHNINFLTSRLTKSRLYVKCMDGSCKWYVGAVMKPKQGTWMVTSYGGPHSCMTLGMALDGRMMDCNFLAVEFVPMLRENHTATIQHLRDYIKGKYYEHKLSYYKIWDAKQRAIAKIFGDWEESYERLKKVLLAYLDKKLAPGTGISLNQERKVLQYCDMYFGLSLLALKDSDIVSQFALGDVIANKDICIISDRHKGIQNAIANWPRDDHGRVRVYHRYCLRHVASNFNTHFQDATLKSLALKAGYATQEAKFELYMQPIKEAEIEALRKKSATEQQVSEPDPSIMPYTYLMKEDIEKWTQLRDGGYRYRAMTTNVSECFNGVLKGAHGLPIAALVEFTWSKLVASGGGQHSHAINILARACGCGKWQNRKIPCSHAITVLQYLGQDASAYIDPCYSLENAIRTYSYQFVVPKSESLWRDVEGPKWVPDPDLLWAKGRPVKSRIRNEMDGVRRKPGSRRPDSDLREIQQKQSCGLCHQHGHNRRRCPLSRGASTSNTDPT
ncbi:uncharacterized protein LOC142616971 [Castanea sativa]|uniref:uncharacterized protein LOC142616971 n=1 Tax=Castanea sativa TaxID=21020 RepID=UPI003F6505B0